uniref:Uncharacterized protein n=1 Tax=Rhizophora mucronata TaxID=61149 RepID=A0A2P2QA47_RHIMU
MPCKGLVFSRLQRADEGI